MVKKLTCAAFIISALVSCSDKTPEEFTLSSQRVRIDPDYTNLTIPYNMAPLNFTIHEEADAYLTRIYSEKGRSIDIQGKDVLINEDPWMKLLSENRGDTIFFQIRLRTGESWIQYPPIANTIATEPIDRL